MSESDPTATEKAILAREQANQKAQDDAARAAKAKAKEQAKEPEQAKEG